MEVDKKIEDLARPIKMEVDSDVEDANDGTTKTSSTDPVTSSATEVEHAMEVEKTVENLSEMKDTMEEGKADENLSEVKNTKLDIKTEKESSDIKTDESLLDMKTDDSTSSVITGEKLSDDKNNTESSRSDETEPKEIIHLSVEGANEDTNDKIIFMTAEEVKQYLLKKIEEYMSSPMNPLYALREKVKELENTGKTQIDEFSKLYKGLQLLERKQEVFLRKSDILPKITMSHASVSADLPVQPVIKPESLIKKELTVTKIDTPAPNKTTPISTNNVNSSTKPPSKPANIECIDLTDDTEPITPAPKKTTSYSAVSMLKHPAPLPPRPFSSTHRLIPPKPRLKVFSEDRGIVLQWDMPPNPQGRLHDTVASFEISGYQEQKNSVINTLLWKKIGSVKAMSLPMACTLTQFVDGNRYHFAIRAIDIKGNAGHYSDAISIVYNQKSSAKK